MVVCDKKDHLHLHINDEQKRKEKPSEKKIDVKQKEKDNVQDFPKRSEKHNSFEQLNEETIRKRKH